MLQAPSRQNLPVIGEDLYIVGTLMFRLPTRPLTFMNILQVVLIVQYSLAIFLINKSKEYRWAPSSLEGERGSHGSYYLSWRYRLLRLSGLPGEAEGCRASVVGQLCILHLWIIGVTSIESSVWCRFLHMITVHIIYKKVSGHRKFLVETFWCETMSLKTFEWMSK